MVQKYVSYPVIFSEQTDGAYAVFVPDVGVATLGNSFEHAVLMAEDGVGLMLQDQAEFPKATLPTDVDISDMDEDSVNTFVSLMVFDMHAYLQKSSKTVRKNITIPEYLNAYAVNEKINVSKVATQALQQLFEDDDN